VPVIPALGAIELKLVNIKNSLPPPDLDASTVAVVSIVTVDGLPLLTLTVNGTVAVACPEIGLQKLAVANILNDMTCPVDAS
jgi:hypothetical protein